MENIKKNIIIAIKNNIFQFTGLGIEDKVLNINFTTYSHDYSLRSLSGLEKVMQSKNSIKTGTDLIKYLQANMDDKKYIVTMGKHSLDISLTTNYVEGEIKNLLKNQKILKQDQTKQKILVEFSSPNIAKDMHVGHLRSTIIGDSIARLYECQGFDVSRINHIGDFGLQFGMIIEHLLETYPDLTDCNLSISDLQNFYAASKKKFDEDADFQKRSYKKVVELQNGDEKVVSAWNYIKDISRKSYNEIYDRLGIHLSEVGESFYQSRIPSLIDELIGKNLLKEDNGRKIIEIKGYELPLTVIKSDGGYTYDTTDLAALKYRLIEQKMDTIIYVVDSGQSLHFQLLFEVAKLTGWLKDHQEIKHIGFGLVLGSDKKKFRSRDGNTVKLIDLLDESLIKAQKVLDDHKHDHLETEKKEIVKAVAYGSIKYADLSTIRLNNYCFSFDKMLSLKGNTGAYQLYEYVRICSILRNAGQYVEMAIKSVEDFKLTEREEIYLCKILLQFPEIIDKMSEDLLLNSLCSYLYELTNAFSSFHLKCRCLYYDDNKELVRADLNRVLICVATKLIMGQCFDILGINKLEKM